MDRRYSSSFESAASAAARAKQYARILEATIDGKLRTRRADKKKERRVAHLFHLQALISWFEAFS
jgi:hypothetical protein